MVGRRAAVRRYSEQRRLKVLNSGFPPVGVPVRLPIIRDSQCDVDHGDPSQPMDRITCCPPRDFDVL
jgi:hypothetical protein